MRLYCSGIDERGLKCLQAVYVRLVGLLFAHEKVDCVRCYGSSTDVSHIKPSFGSLTPNPVLPRSIQLPADFRTLLLAATAWQAADGPTLNRRYALWVCLLLVAVEVLFHDAEYHDSQYLHRRCMSSSVTKNNCLALLCMRLVAQGIFFSRLTYNP